MKDLFEPLLQESEHELFLYPWEIFELRIQEEMVRADRSNCGFGYMEIGYQGLRNAIVPNVDDRTLWRAVLQFIAETLRGSDIKGYLADNRGVGLVFLDSDLTGLVGCRSRFWAHLTKLGWLKDGLAENAVLEIMKVTLYPLEKAS